MVELVGLQIKPIPFQIYLISQQDYLLVPWQRFTHSGFVCVSVCTKRKELSQLGCNRSGQDCLDSGGCVEWHAHRKSPDLSGHVQAS